MMNKLIYLLILILILSCKKRDEFTPKSSVEWYQVDYCELIGSRHQSILVHFRNGETLGDHQFHRNRIIYNKGDFLKIKTSYKQTYYGNYEEIKSVLEIRDKNGNKY